MKLWIVAAAVWTAAAQPAPEVRVEAVDAGSIIYVKNTAPQPLTAFLVELVGYPGSSFALAQEELPEGIAPGVERRIPVRSMLVGAAPDYVKITAAIFADKTTLGPPDKVSRLTAARKTTLAAVRDAIRAVEGARDRDTALAALRQVRNGGRVIEDATTRLEKGTVRETAAWLKRAEAALSAAL
jgi:hypothetical protein